MTALTPDCAMCKWCEAHLEVVRALHAGEVRNSGPGQLRNEEQVERQHTQQHQHIFNDSHTHAGALAALEAPCIAAGVRSPHYPRLHTPGTNCYHCRMH